MCRVLIVEDQVDFYEDYILRLFRKLLPMDKIFLRHVPTLKAALVSLQEPWDAILMDYSLGTSSDFLGDPVRDGSDLIAFRRAIEKQRGLPAARILGISSNKVGNELMIDKGASGSVTKLDVPTMAKFIKGVMNV